jgi:hypothetical protein
MFFLVLLRSSRLVSVEEALGESQRPHFSRKERARNGAPAQILKVEAVTEFPVDLPRIVPVKSAEGEAVVELHAAVGHINSGH